MSGMGFCEIRACVYYGLCSYGFSRGLGVGRLRLFMLGRTVHDEICPVFFRQSPGRETALSFVHLLPPAARSLALGVTWTGIQG